MIIIAISIIVLFGYEIGDYDSYKRVLTFGLPSGLILLALLNLEKNDAISFPKFTIDLGNVSSGLYTIQVMGHNRPIYSTVIRKQ